MKQKKSRFCVFHGKYWENISMFNFIEEIRKIIPDIRSEDPFSYFLCFSKFNLLLLNNLVLKPACKVIVLQGWDYILQLLVCILIVLVCILNDLVLSVVEPWHFYAGVI